MKNVFSVIGKIGAAALGLGALVLAGKSEFGKNFGSAGGDESAEDLAATLVPLGEDASEADPEEAETSE